MDIFETLHFSLKTISLEINALDQSSSNYVSDVKKIISRFVDNGLFMRQAFRLERGSYNLSVNVNQQTLNVSTNFSSVFVNVPDPDCLTLRMKPSEISRTNLNAGEGISSNGYLTSNYSWSSLASLELILDSLNTDDSKTGSYISNYISRLPIDINANCFVETTLFGVGNRKSENCFRFYLSPNDFVAFLRSVDDISNALAIYDFVVFKTVPSTINVKSTSLSDAQIKTCAKPKKNIYVIFSDSFDLDILNYDSNYSYPAIKHLLSSGLHFNKFSASADWTFPILHQLHSGKSIHETHSFKRFDPIVYFSPDIELINWKKTLNYSESRSALKGLYCSDFNPSNMLAPILSSFGFRVLGLKSSNNHGLMHGLNRGFDTTIEAADLDAFPHYYESISHELDLNGNNVVFVDLDQIHRMDGRSFLQRQLLEFSSLQSHLASTHVNKIQKLKYKSSDTLDFELQVYMHNARLIDQSLQLVLESSNESDDIIFFSDHGSPLFNKYPRCDDTLSESFKLDLDYLWKPTLILSSSDLNNRDVDTTFTTTQDLYYCILRLALGSDYDKHFPISALHPVLGGSLCRNLVPALLRRIGSHSLADPNYISLVRLMDDSFYIECHDFEY